MFGCYSTSGVPGEMAPAALRAETLIGCERPGSRNRNWVVLIVQEGLGCWSERNWLLLMVQPIMEEGNEWGRHRLGLSLIHDGNINRLPLVCMRACIYVCGYVCVCACVRAFVCACVRACVRVGAQPDGWGCVCRIDTSVEWNAQNKYNI